MEKLQTPREIADRKIWENREEWMHLVTGECCVCEKLIKNAVQNYIERGNFCTPCNAKASLRADKAYRPAHYENYVVCD